MAARRLHATVAPPTVLTVHAQGTCGHAQSTHDSPPGDWGFSRTHTAAVAPVPMTSEAQDQGQRKDAGRKVTGMPRLRGPLGTRAAADCGLEPRRHGPSWSPRPRPTEVSPEGTQVAGGLDGLLRALRPAPWVSEIVAEVLGSRGPACLSPWGSRGSPGRAGCRKRSRLLTCRPGFGRAPCGAAEVCGFWPLPPSASTGLLTVVNHRESRGKRVSLVTSWSVSIFSPPFLLRLLLTGGQRPSRPSEVSAPEVTQAPCVPLALFRDGGFEPGL